MKHNISARKRKLRLIGGLFTLFLIAFTLFGNTLLALTLPKVVTSEASKGELANFYKGSAVLRPVQELELTNPAGWKVMKVLVGKGENVQKGQSLIMYDSTEAKQQIEDEQAALQKLELTISLLENDYIEAAHKEDHTPLLQAQAALEGAKIDRDIQKKHIQAAQKKLLSNQKLVAPFAGIITDIKAMEGLAVGGADIRLSNSSKGFQFELKIPVSIAALLTIGEEMEAQLMEKKSRLIQGNISSMEDSEPENASSLSLQGATSTDEPATRVVVAVQDKTVKGGESVRVNIAKKGSEDTLLIASTAIRKDQTGTYVYTIETRQGPLGNAFYAVRRPITILNANEHTTAVSEGLFDKEQVITESSVPLMDGDRIRL
jgi:RND family efflux transporter MFP subunit